MGGELQPCKETEKAGFLLYCQKPAAKPITRVKCCLFFSFQYAGDCLYTRAGVWVFGFHPVPPRLSLEEQLSLLLIFNRSWKNQSSSRE